MSLVFCSSIFADSVIRDVQAGPVSRDEAVSEYKGE